MIEEELYNFKNLAKYVTDDVEIDPQVWWSTNGKPMPMLFKFSQIYLVPNTSLTKNVRLISIATRICAPHRAMLTGETIESLVTLKHRMVVKKRTNLISSIRPLNYISSPLSLLVLRKLQYNIFIFQLTNIFKLIE